MSAKRELAGRLFPAGLPFGEMLLNNAHFTRMRHRFADCATFEKREDMYAHLAAPLRDKAIDYLEFGVWQGASIKYWASLNSHPESRFVGFDTFEGLPEDWDDSPKGTFSTKGKMPVSDDYRISFEKGLFQDTLPGHLAKSPPTGDLVMHVDCDLYSSTLFVLGTLHPCVRRGTVIIFDDFYSLNHEFRAFFDYDRSFGIKWTPAAKLPHCNKVAIRID